MPNACGCYPPDTNGAAGQNHYVQVVNAQFAAWTKTGTQVVPPTNINTLFPAAPHCGVLNRGDPVVVYDQFAQRFVISQFAFNGTGGTPPYWECTAVSATSDPTGAWCGYEFEVSPTKFNDYPKIGVWPSQQSYTMTANQFLLGATYAGVGIWAFERDAMLNCQTARFVYQDMEAIDPYLPATLPADADGDTPPPAGAPAPFVSINQDGSGLPQDQIQITNATVDWSALRRSRSRTTQTSRRRRTTRICATSARASLSPGRPSSSRRFPIAGCGARSTATSAAGRRSSRAIRATSATTVRARAGTASRRSDGRLADARPGDDRAE
jgi:hypothetical protein